MRYRLLLLLGIFGPASSMAQSSSTKATSAGTRASAVPEEETLLAVRHARVPSAVYHTVRDIPIWIPNAGVNAAARYPVIVFPDAEEKGQFRSALANLQFLIDRRLIPPVMVVGLPFLANRRHELTPAATGTTAKLYPAAGGADESLQFIADELLPWVDSHYPTLPTRILVGHSLGGLFALDAMVKRPDLFRLVIAASPILTWNDGAFSEDVAARLAADTAHTRALFVTSGGLEPPVDEATSRFATHLTTLLDSLHSSHLRFARRRYAGDPHEMTPLPSLVDGIRMVFEPVFVPIDSVVGEFVQHQVRDSAAIHEAARKLESRYAAGAAALGIAPQFPESPLDVLAGYCVQVDQPALAVRFLRENLDHYPKSSNAHESLGEGLIAVGDTAGAVAEFRAAIAISKPAIERSSSVLVRGHERDVMTAAADQLHALNRTN